MPPQAARSEFETMVALYGKEAKEIKLNRLDSDHPRGNRESEDSS